MIKLELVVAALLLLTGCHHAQKVVMISPGWYKVAIYDEKDRLVMMSKLGEPVVSTTTVTGWAVALYPLK